MQQHFLFQPQPRINPAALFTPLTFELSRLKFDTGGTQPVQCLYCASTRGAFMLNPDIEETWVCADCHDLIQSLDPSDPLLDLGGEG